MGQDINIYFHLGSNEEELLKRSVEVLEKLEEDYGNTYNNR